MLEEDMAWDRMDEEHRSARRAQINNEFEQRYGFYPVIVFTPPEAFKQVDRS